jgi:hypothetical protein
MQQSHSWEAKSRLAGQEIPPLQWNMKFHNHVHQNLPLDSVLVQMNPVRTLPLTYYLPIYTKVF